MDTIRALSIHDHADSEFVDGAVDARISFLLTRGKMTANMSGDITIGKDRDDWSVSGLDSDDAWLSGRLLATLSDDEVVALRDAIDATLNQDDCEDAAV